VDRLKAYLDLFLTFVRIGALMFGGGYAMLPLLQRELVEKRQWTDEEELADYFAIGQCTPGVIAINTATFIGMKQKGVPGALAATLGMVCPSLIIITIIFMFIRNFMEYAAVRYAFNGIRACVVVLIGDALFKLMKSAIKDRWTLGIFLAVFLLMSATSLSPVLLIVAAGFAGCVIQALKGGGRA